MFDLISALIILPLFAASSVCFRSWLFFNESKKMFVSREEELENELETIFKKDAADTCLDKNLLKFNYDSN